MTKKYTINTIPGDGIGKDGEMMDKDGLKKVSDCDPILLGAVGIRNVQDHVSL